MEGAPTSSVTRSYRTVRQLARGGMGQVDIVARKEGHFQRVYALKRMHGVFADDPDVRAMFVDEARIAGLIRHSNVVSVIDAGEDDGGPFLVMDFVEGLNASRMTDALKQRGVIWPVQLALEVVRQAALGLHAAHELRGESGQPLDVVHRDVSPQNLLIGFDGVVRVTDFGVARALDRITQTVPGALKGKVGYMSPEQLTYDELDRRSDLFSLGVVLYELIAGHRLYADDQPVAFRRILKEAPPDVRTVRPEVSPGVAGLIASMLAKRADERPASGREVADRIDAELRALRTREVALSLERFLEAHLADELEQQRQWVAMGLTGPSEATEAPLERPLVVSPVRARRGPSALALALGAGVLAAGLAALGFAIGLTSGAPDEGASQAEGSPSAIVPAAIAAPVDAVPVDAVPVDAVPVDAVPVEAVPVDAVPVEAPIEPIAAEPPALEAALEDGAEPADEVDAIATPARARRGRRRPSRLGTRVAPATGSTEGRRPRPGDVIGLDGFHR